MAALARAVGVLLGFAATARGLAAINKTHNARQLERHNETHITLVNATPYRWHKIYNHSYQLIDWEDEWPEYIGPGNATTVSVKSSMHAAPWNTAGEATYRIEDTRKPMSLKVEYLSAQQHTVTVQFLQHLETIYSKKNTEYNIGFSKDEGGVGFILAGTEGDFISNNVPTAWMQAQLGEIGHLPLREIAMPRSHHAGLWKDLKHFGFGGVFNSQTQTLTLYEQLARAGVRVLDVRPALKKGKFYEHHGTHVLGNFHGMLGATIKEMVNMQNKFMEDYPGELYIWDIHEREARDGDKKFKALDEKGRQKLYEELSRLDNRMTLLSSTDLTKLPLKDFIGNGVGGKPTSCVLVRLPSSWTTEGDFPGLSEGFVTNNELPLKTRWSDTNQVKMLVKDQIEGLKKARPSRSSSSGLYNMDWLITQQGSQAAFPHQSLVKLSGAAWRTLYKEFWEALTDESFPNWITMDGIHDSSHKVMAMAINKCLGVRKCGYLGGRVAGMANTTWGFSPEVTTGNGAQG